MVIRIDQIEFYTYNKENASWSSNKTTDKRLNLDEDMIHIFESGSSNGQSKLISKFLEKHSPRKLFQR